MYTLLRFYISISISSSSSSSSAHAPSICTVHTYTEYKVFISIPISIPIPTCNLATRQISGIRYVGRERCHVEKKKSPFSRGGLKLKLKLKKTGGWFLGEFYDMECYGMIYHL